MRRFTIAAIVVVGIVAILAASAPLIISTDVIKRAIADQITNWTGRTVTFSGEPRISLFPYLTVRLRDVTLANPPGMEGEPFMRMDMLAGKLEILPLLIGRTEIAQFRLVNPKINLTIDSKGRANWQMNQGSVGTKAAKRDKEAPGTDAAPPSPQDDIRLGRFIVRGGTVTFTDERQGFKEQLTDLGLDFAWPATSEASSGSGSFTWRGEAVEFNSSIGTPLQLLAGGVSPVHFALASTPLRIAFDGTALRLDNMQVEGQVQITTPSVRRVLAWTGTPMGEGSILGAAALKGKINWFDSAASFADATVELDGNSADGAVTVDMANGKPGLQGTLAFDRLDLSPYLEAVHAGIGSGGAWDAAPIAVRLSEVGNVDLRISADQIVLGSTEIGPAAASALVKDGKLTVSLGDAELYGGNADARLTAEMQDGALVGTAELKLDQIPARTALTAILGQSAIDGTASATIDLAAAGKTWGDFMKSLNGTAEFAIENGVFDYVDVTTLPAMIATPGAAPAGSTSFTSAACTVTIGGGVAATDSLRAEGPGFSVDLAGKASLFDANVDARGVLTLAADDDATRQTEVPFMVEGSWTAPRLLPDFGRPIQRDETLPAEEKVPVRAPNG